MGFAIFMFIFAGFCFGMAIYSINQRSKENQSKEERIQAKGNEYDSIYSLEVNHICGLLLTENSICTIHLCASEIIVEGTNNIYRLQKDRIIDMNFKTSKEVQNSISGAIGGAMLFGPIGAFLGGTTTEFHRFFIIIYKGKNNENKCISFDIKDDMKKYKKIYEYIENYKDNIEEKAEIEL